MNAAHSLRRLGWRRWQPWHLVASVLLVAAGTAWTWSTWEQVGVIALASQELGHFILVPVVMGWLMWVRRERLRMCQPVGRWIGPVMIVAGWAMGKIGRAASLEVVSHAGALSILMGGIFSVLGIQVLRAFLPAFALLLLVIPTPWTVHQHLILPFNAIAIRISLVFYEFVGVPAVWSGGILTIGDVSFPVLAICDAPGLKAVFLVAYGFAFGRPLRLPVRLLILGLTPITALFFQILGTIVISGLAAVRDTDPSLLAVLAGWLLLPMVFLVLCWLVKLLHWALIPVQTYSLAQDR